MWPIYSSRKRRKTVRGPSEAFQEKGKEKNVFLLAEPLSEKTVTSVGRENRVTYCEEVR